MQPLPQQNQSQLEAVGIDDFEVRQRIAKTLKGFALIYLPHYLYLAPGEFHDELIHALESPDDDMLLIEGFRGSTKSTWGSLIMPLWAALVEKERYPFIIPIADTVTQASLNVANIKAELDSNELIKQDFGTFDYGKPDDISLEDPTLESEEEWQAKNLLLSNGVRILARSRGQKIRGLRHRQYRPRLIVIDDPEDSKWVRTKENRDTSERWMNAEVMGAIDDKHRKLVVIGNLLHSDALLPRLEKRGIFKVLHIPLFAKDGHCVWPALYPDKAALDKKQRGMGPISWQREMLLHPVPDEGAPLAPEDIHYYDDMPPEVEHGLTGTGDDPAISKKMTADFTAMVTARSAWVGDKPQIYIMPNPVNERLDVSEHIARARAIDMLYQGQHMFYVESVAFQKALIELMQKELLPVEEVKPLNDKRARLMVVLPYIKNGTVKFPRQGCEELIGQLLGFGVEEHDDLVDAMVNVINGLVNSGLQMPEVTLLG